MRLDQRSRTGSKSIKSVVTDEIADNVDVDQKDAILAASVADAAAISQRMKDSQDGGEEGHESVNSLIDST